MSCGELSRSPHGHPAMRRLAVNIPGIRTAWAIAEHSCWLDCELLWAGSQRANVQNSTVLIYSPFFSGAYVMDSASNFQRIGFTRVWERWLYIF